MKKRYDPSTECDPLFDELPEQAASASEGAGIKRETAVGSGWCPEHHGERRTGVIRQGTHVVWRVHEKRTIGGAVIPCRGSGVSLCEAPPRAVVEQIPHEPPHCTHATQANP